MELQFKNIDIKELEESNQFLPQFEKREGLLPVVVQEYGTGQILMVASVNKEALDYSIQHKIAAFYSTSRNSLWIKGETSGNYLAIKEILIDCDQDAIIYQVELTKGGVCHTFNIYGENRKSCFYRNLDLDSKKLSFLEL